MAGALVLRAGFKDIVVGSFFRDATIKKGESLHESGHVFDVSERFTTAASATASSGVRHTRGLLHSYRGKLSFFHA